MKRRKLNLKAKVESSITHFCFKCLVPDGVTLVLIGSTCTALPRAEEDSERAKPMTTACSVEVICSTATSVSCTHSSTAAQGPGFLGLGLRV